MMSPIYDVCHATELISPLFLFSKRLQYPDTVILAFLAKLNFNNNFPTLFDAQAGEHYLDLILTVLRSL